MLGTKEPVLLHLLFWVNSFTNIKGHEQSLEKRTRGKEKTVGVEVLELRVNFLFIFLTIVFNVFCTFKLLRE